MVKSSASINQQALSGRFESSILEMVLNIGGKYCGVYFGMSQEIMFLAWNLFSDIIRPPIDGKNLGFLCVCGTIFWMAADFLI